MGIRTDAEQAAWLNRHAPKRQEPEPINLAGVAEEIGAALSSSLAEAQPQLVEIAKGLREQQKESEEVSMADVDKPVVVLTDDELRALEAYRATRDVEQRKIQAQADEEKRIDGIAAAALTKKTLTAEEASALRSRIGAVLAEMNHL